MPAAWLPDEAGRGVGIDRDVDEADLIIAKGQGNFESLGDTAKKVFFLLRPKCAVLARHLNCEQGRLMVIESGATRE